MNKALEASICNNLTAIHKRIDAACKRAGRNSDEITLIAVSKTKPNELISEAILAGQRIFGENKPQELRDKASYFAKYNLQWHMIGSLQKNKIKYVLDNAILIHSIDSLDLAEAVSKEAQKRNKSIDILLEVNIAGEETKHGFHPDELPNMAAQIKSFSGVNLRGLMTVAPNTENPESNRVYFMKMRQLLIDIKTKNADNNSINILSMGMTSDFETAIEEGATMVRVGTGIFGERIYPLL